MADRLLDPNLDGRRANLRFQRRIRELRAERDAFAAYARPALYDESGFPITTRDTGGLSGRVRRILSGT
ncbi:MAG: hypothetical protein NVSMB25_04240 [Thermoleophilaceae bacterium]